MKLAEIGFFIWAGFLALVLTVSAVARADAFVPLQGVSVTTGQSVTANLSPEKKGLVVVFVSDRCPCSASHEAMLKKLSADYPEFNFIGVHSNTDEPIDEAKAHFTAAALPFEVIQDVRSSLANRFHALKTPHAFVITPDQKIVYEGGVTDSHVAENARKFYLRSALDDLRAGHQVQVAMGRTLGCVIARGD